MTPHDVDLVAEKVKQTSRKLTLKDMARRLGVSTATVSNAFNRPDQLSRDLRERILDACHASGYHGPNAAARSLRTGKTGIIGVFLSNYLAYSFRDPVAQQFLQGLAEVFEESDYSILVVPSRDHVKQSHGYESFVDGFIIYGPPQQQPLQQLIDMKKSIITVDFEIDGYPAVNIDNFQGARDCAMHALSNSDGPVTILGLRLLEANRICRIQDNELFDAESIITIQRLQGFLDAAKEAGMDIPYNQVFHIPDNTHELGYQAAREALTRSPTPRLLLCMSDRIALAAMQAARHLGLRVPEDLKVTGFDDIPEAGTHHPTLTTVHQQSIDKGRIAAEIYQGRRPEENVLLPTDLVIRESCP